MWKYRFETLLTRKDEKYKCSVNHTGSTQKQTLFIINTQHYETYNMITDFAPDYLLTCQFYRNDVYKWSLKNKI